MSRRRQKYEKTLRNSSIDHSAKSKAQYYKNLKIPGEGRNSNQTAQPAQNSMILRTQTANLGSGGFQNMAPQQAPPIRSNMSTNFGNINAGGFNGNNAPLRRNISTNPGIVGMGGNMGQNAASFGNINSIQQRAYASQSGGLPPLFIGFLTNDVSMKHVQFMVDT